MASWCALAGACLYLGVVATPRLRAAVGGRTTYQHVNELVGHPLRAIQTSDGDARWLVGSGPPAAHLLYLFSTSCHFCESQKEHIARLLSTLPESAVITGSVEPAWQTTGYWRATGRPLPPPVSLDSAWLRMLGVGGVPTIIVVRPDGVIADVVTGVVLDWTPQTLRDELTKAEGAVAPNRSH